MRHTVLPLTALKVFDYF